MRHDESLKRKARVTNSKPSCSVDPLGIGKSIWAWEVPQAEITANDTKADAELVEQAHSSGGQGSEVLRRQFAPASVA